MAQVISTLDNAVEYLNFLYNGSSTEPTSGEEDYLVWTGLFNIAVDVWENEEGILWRELFGKLSGAADGDKTTAAGDTSYSVPTNFRFPASGFVWLGSNTAKTAYKVIPQEDIQLYENDTSNWCYFLMDGSPTLEFNPNITMLGGETINYIYYKKATKLSSGSDTFEMSDPMFAVYFALAELKKEEGNNAEVQMSMNKLEGMKSRNELPPWNMENSLLDKVNDGFGV